MSDIPTASELDAMTKEELLGVANEDMGLGVPVNDTKADVRAAIDAAIAGGGSTAPTTQAAAEGEGGPPFTDSYGVPMTQIDGTSQWVTETAEPKESETA